MTGLRSLALEDLAALMADADDELRQAIVAECDRRDRPPRGRRPDPVEAEWRDAAHAQFLAAEAATRGVLLNKRGIAAGIDPWSLWSGPARRATAFASWELREYWETSARLTVSEYKRQLASARRIQADDAERDRLVLPPVPELVAMVRQHGPEVLARYAPEVLEEIIGPDTAATWLGIERGSIYREKTRGRWPESELPVGRSLGWRRRTLIVHLAARTGRGAPGKPRAPRKRRSVA